MSGGDFGTLVAAGWAGRLPGPNKRPRAALTAGGMASEDKAPTRQEGYPPCIACRSLLRRPRQRRMTMNSARRIRFTGCIFGAVC